MPNQESPPGRHWVEPDYAALEIRALASMAVPAEMLDTRVGQVKALYVSSGSAMKYKPSQVIRLSRPDPERSPGVVHFHDIRIERVMLKKRKSRWEWLRAPLF
jgi:hypothetical protein